MAENRGKQFEEQIRKAFELVPGTYLLRLHDQMSGFKGSSNICDFVAYRYPIQYFIECKSCHGGTFPFGNITDTQWTLANIDVPGIIAGYMIWFIDKDRTIFVPAKIMREVRDSGAKSFSITNPQSDKFIEIQGTKRRVLYDYDLLPFVRRFSLK